MGLEQPRKAETVVELGNTNQASETNKRGPTQGVKAESKAADKGPEPMEPSVTQGAFMRNETSVAYEKPGWKDPK